MVKHILNGSQMMGKSKRTRILLILLCCFLCASAFLQPQAEAVFRPINEQLDGILIRSNSRIEVVKDISVPCSFLHCSAEYQRWFENKQVWIHTQGLLYGEEPVAVLYVQFRNREEAVEGLANRMAEPIEGRSFVGRVMGPFAVFVSSSKTRGSEIADRLFGLIERSYREGTAFQSLDPLG